MHSSLALTVEGVPLGLAAVKVWTRQKFKGTAALKKKINPMRVPIEKKESIVLSPIGKWKRYPPLVLTVIHAEEAGTPRNRKKISWKLITNLPVDSRRAAVEKLEWYAMRWKIELFYKILKSGCRAEDSRLRTAQRLANLIAVFCIVSWRVFWMTMLNRAAPDAPAEMALTASEIRLLDQVLTTLPNTRKTLSYYLTKIARLGGYLARGSDPPPGNLVMWRGLSRLRDIEIGASISAICG